MAIGRKTPSRLTDRLAQLIGSPNVDDYHWTSGWNTAALQMLVGLRAGQRLLDIGCGSGRLARGLSGWFGSGYVGVDIVPELIEYCRKTYPEFRFELLDLNSDLYNPEGLKDPGAVQLDLPDASFDCVTMFSVLTHVTTEVTRSYLEESHRLLAPGGSLFFTCFLLNDERPPTEPDHVFAHRYDEGCLYENPDVVSDAVAYREDAMHRLLEAASLQVVYRESGTWRGEPGLAYQDVVIVQRQEDCAGPGAVA